MTSTSPSAIGSFVIGVSEIDSDLFLSETLPPLPFTIVEITTSDPTQTSLVAQLAHGMQPHGALIQLGEFQSAMTIRASDASYRSAATDSGGVIAYPPVLDQAFQIDVSLNLDPTKSGVAAAWGAVKLSNATRQYDTIARTRNADGLPVRVLSGAKTFDEARQYWTDPSYAALTLAFAGQATPWFLSDTALTIDLRDVTYWLEKPYQGRLYRGTGGYDGPASLAGVPVPRTRGGTHDNPVRNVTPTLFDPVRLIYQYSDGPGTVVHLYEGAAEVFVSDGDTTDLFTGAPSAGHYRTDNGKAMFQLGSSPVHAITADVTGQFPGAGVVTTWAQILRRILSEDMLVPLVNMDAAAFALVDAAYPYIAGIFVGSAQNLTGIDVIEPLLSGVCAYLVPYADGKLRPLVLRAVTGAPAATFDLVNIVKISPVALPASISPPPKRVRLGYNANNTIQTSDLNVASASTAQAQFVSQPASIATAAGPGVSDVRGVASDPPVILGALLSAGDAQTVANDILALFGVRRRLYDVEVPVSEAVGLDIGAIVQLRYPLDDLDAGRNGQIVRRTFATGDATSVLRVLI